MSDSLWWHGLYSPWNSPGPNTGVGSLLQGIFPTLGLNPGLPHCRQILYQLSHQEAKCNFSQSWRRWQSERWAVQILGGGKKCGTGEGNGNPFQYSCLETPMESSVLKSEGSQSWTLLSNWPATASIWQSSLGLSGSACQMVSGTSRSLGVAGEEWGRMRRRGGPRDEIRGSIRDHRALNQSMMELDGSHWNI